MTKKKSKIRIGNVKGDVTISQDQSGGTTAHETTTANDKKPSKSKWSIITVISVISLILAILTYLGVKPSKENKMPKDEEEKISIGDVNGDVVISQNQSGGITANKVNVNVNTNRSLKPNVASSLVEGLRQHPCPITIGVLGMGGEPDQFANQLFQIVKASGCEAHGVNHGIGFQPFNGLLVKYSPVKTPTETVTLITSILKQSGIDCTPVSDQRLKPGSIYLYVGYQP